MSAAAMLASGVGLTTAGFAVPPLGEGSDSVERLNRTLIEQELCAYILDKAESVGVHTVSAEVEVAWDDAGYWYPVGASICCDATNEQREKLGALIEAELGIPADRQEWSEVKNG